MKPQDNRRRWVAGCPTGKRGFIARAGAKAAGRQVAKAGSPGLRPYVCDQCNYWHLGHKPTATMRGLTSASEWYAR